MDDTIRLVGCGFWARPYAPLKGIRYACQIASHSVRMARTIASSSGRWSNESDNTISSLGCGFWRAHTHSRMGIREVDQQAWCSVRTAAPLLVGVGGGVISRKTPSACGMWILGVRTYVLSEGHTASVGSVAFSPGWPRNR